MSRLFDLSTFLGHVSPSSTAVYLTITTELLDCASESFRTVRVEQPKGVYAMSASTTTLGSILASFFNDHLKLQRDCGPTRSPATRMRCDCSCSSLRKQPERRITQLGLDDLDADVCPSFLNSLEGDRKKRGSVPQPALGGPPHFLRIRRPAIPGSTGAGQKVASIPRKRLSLRRRSFSNAMRSKSTLALLPVEGRHALRDRTLLVFLYNTGARVQEASDLRASDVHFDPTPRVHLHGKGDKWRICPLWAETATLLKKLVIRAGTDADPDRPVFIGAKDAALTRFGIYKIIRRYTTHVVKRTRSDGRLKSRIAPRLAPQHGGASLGSRRRGECHSRLARPREPGNNQSLR